MSVLLAPDSVSFRLSEPSFAPFARAKKKSSCILRRLGERRTRGKKLLLHLAPFVQRELRMC